ncbi:hypothetical protein GCM10011588_10830 [Nocardia jinanensis]|uniref:Uncharacterized protein n=1 Tax=Nocardia jinanensis TaxID=382504 RepID=A0A917RAV6_9NOCA|nr:hypothetical protein GCM10011588_10830 [Nocardia jinanensis]
MLHRPREQELVELLEFERTRGPPPEVLRDQPEVVGAGLGAAAIGTDLGAIDPQLLGQPGYRDRRGSHHPIGHEPQPRQRAQRDRDTEPIGRTTPPTGIDERQIRRREREEPEQLLTADLRELPQPRQLLIREHPRRHETDLPPTNSVGSQANQSPPPPQAEPGTHQRSAAATPYPLVFRRLLPEPLQEPPSGGRVVADSEIGNRWNSQFRI